MVLDGKKDVHLDSSSIGAVSRLEVLEGPTGLRGRVRRIPNSRHSISAHYANEPSPSDQAPPMQRAAINRLSNGIALPNRGCIVQCRRKHWFDDVATEA
jgi:transposase